MDPTNLDERKNDGENDEIKDETSDGTEGGAGQGEDKEDSDWEEIEADGFTTKRRPGPYFFGAGTS